MTAHRFTKLALTALSFSFLMLGTASAQLFPVTPVPITLTPPAGNGDVNPYGIAFVPKGIAFGKTAAFNSGDLLISTFNDVKNTAGLGTTITRVTPKGQVSNFFTAARMAW